MAIKSKIEDEAEGCFTSMIDIVFLLLIYFVVQPFKAPEMRMQSYLPKDTGQGSAPTDPKPTITLKIMRSNGGAEYAIGDKFFNNGNLISSRLYDEAGGDKTVPVVITPAIDVQFKHVLLALDQCAFAGMLDVKFSAPQ